MKLLRAIGSIALVIVAFPFALIAGIVSRGRKCTPNELASELRELATGNMRLWDQLECVPLKDPRLEAIRQEAITVEVPFREQDRTLLEKLAAKAETLIPRI